MPRASAEGFKGKKMFLVLVVGRAIVIMFWNNSICVWVGQVWNLGIIAKAYRFSSKEAVTCSAPEGLTPRLSLDVLYIHGNVISRMSLFLEGISNPFG